MPGAIKVLQFSEGTSVSAPTSPTSFVYSSSGQLDFQLNGANANTVELEFAKAGSVKWGIYETNTSTPDLRIWSYGSASADVFTLTPAGAVTIGATNGVATHTLNVAASGNAVKCGPAGSSARACLIVDNVANSQGVALNASSAGSYVTYGGGTLSFVNSTYADSVSPTSAGETSGTVRGSVTTAGSWTLGTVNIAATHTLNVAPSGNAVLAVPGGSSARAALIVKNAANSQSIALNASNASSYLVYGGGTLNFVNTTYADAVSATSAGESGTVVGSITAAGAFTIGTGTSTTHRLNTVVGTTVGAAGGASALPATPTGYITININGTDRKIPYYAT